ncbi:MAG: PolC-type DNA polymerase III [Lachnospiraceae bacterium]|jgi:DNA polymerase-3 subunit alpha (Gram-positive type)|nr:PolC-type DNA polymerase III [Lachnospiraceae bacterium]
MAKILKDIFLDYKSNDSIVNVELEKANLLKKSNKLEIYLNSSVEIKLDEISRLETYLKTKFNLEDVTTYIKYPENICMPDVSQLWGDFLTYIENKYPIVKSILKNSKIEVEDKDLNIVLELKGADILYARKVDEKIMLLLNSIFNKKYRVKFVDTAKKQEGLAYLKKLEADAINVAKKEMLEKKVVEETVVANEDNEDKSPSKIITGRVGRDKTELVQIKEVAADSGKVAIQGEVILVEKKELKTGKVLIIYNVYDGTSTITCKTFAEAEKAPQIEKRIRSAKILKVIGNAQYDPYAKELGIMTNGVIEMPEIKKKKREDNAKEKRVELHVHTKLSQMDGVSNPKDIVKRAANWGMKAIAITDHGGVQAFPEVNKAAKDAGIKVLYGVEAYLTIDEQSSVANSKNQDINSEYCVLDIETTGLSFRTEKITEIGVMKMKNGQVIDTFECFVNPEKQIPYEIVKLTGITDDMVKNEKTIKEVMPEFLKFVGDSILVAHNAGFDIGFLKYNAENLGYKLDNTIIDTLSLAKELFPNYKKYKLGIIAENLGIKVDVAHRALDDVKTLVSIFNIMLNMLTEKKVKTVNEIESVSKDMSFKNMPSYHAIILVQNYIGLKNLYKLISISHLDYFYKKPRILKSIYKQYSEGLIIGSACEQGELYRAIVEGKADEDIEKIAKEYDYLEIQPTGNNMYMVRNGVLENEEQVQNINKKIVSLGEKLEKLVVGTCDVHFLDPQDEIYRRILQAGQGYDDADFQAPLYLRTTEEMLKEFEYLGNEKAYEIVVTNTNKISDMCEEICPISKEKCPPHIEGCEKEIEEIAVRKAKELYGENLPQIVKERMEKELNSIIKNGFSVMYIIAQKLVQKSNEDGYIVGSRGSVGSSFVAYLLGITEVNSLIPHYRCENCKYSEFEEYNKKNGFDLPDKTCPNCGTKLSKDGMDIPFETFLGFDGDKEPDIDLNFSGEYQTKAHKYTEELFGKGKTFKAGTIGTIADKTAYGYVKNYYEEKNIPVNSAEIIRIAAGCTGVKRTTGQHPGGIIVVPEEREIYEFCPVQHPADDTNSDVITTHFDYHSIDQNLLKLDILGHDGPTMIRMLFDMTGIDPTKVPLDEKKTMSIFSTTEALGVSSDKINSTVGTYGIPEFGTKLVRDMLVDTKPTTFNQLVCISGLSHGEDVWLNNAKDLIDSGSVTLDEAICTRDDIMIYLIKAGLEPKSAFKIMEAVRKGRGLTEEDEKLMKEHNVPSWYIKSCKKIKYMFPKAHAAAYVTNAFRIAWFKVYYPLAYYATYFTVRADDFDSDLMIYGKEKVKQKIKELEMQGNALSTKDKNVFSILEIVLEMYERGLKFLPIDLYKSHANKFQIEDGAIRPPLNSIAGLGTVAAVGIDEAKKTGEFMCIDELKQRAKIGKAVIEMLQKAGCLKGMPESNQMSLFI